MNPGVLTAGQVSPVVQSIQLLWRAKWWLVAAAILGGLGGFWFVGKTERVYRAEAVLVPVSMRERGPLEGMGDLSGLASLAGISLDSDSTVRVALATLRGKEFTARFIEDNNLMPLLFPDRWDAGAKHWRGSPPTMLQAVDLFDRGGIRKVIEDRKSGLVTVQIDWKDRAQAVKWLTSMVDRVNSRLREKAIGDSRRSIEFLTAESERTQSVPVRDAIFRLVESQMKQVALASGQPEYALKYVDRPIVPDSLDFIWPRPVFLVCLGILIGGVAGGVLFLIYANLGSLRRALRGGLEA